MYLQTVKDLKPANILVAKSGDVKLADFGLARYYGSPEKEMTQRVITK
jgi:cyclin-dependent kinase 7